MQLCSVFPRSHWPLPCAVPWGCVPFQAASMSTWSCTNRCGGFSRTCFLPVLWLVQSWMQPRAWCSVPNLLPVQSSVCHKGRALCLQSAKASMEAPNPGAVKHHCCLSTDETLPPPRWQRVGFGLCCQGFGAASVQLPSAGLLQIFMVVFESKTRIIKQLGFRERPFFGSV